MSTDTLTAAKIRAVLRHHDVRTSHVRGRQGVRVSDLSGGAVYVSADLDSDREAARLAESLAEVLRGEGFKVEALNDHAMRVAR